MLLHATGDPERTLAIPQTSHAWLAWQLAERWGNRHFNRALPRAEVLSAVMLHDSGWTEYDAAPDVDDDGRIRTFNRMQVEVQLEIWRASVDRTALTSRYSALLVAEHFAGMAKTRSGDLLEQGDTWAARLTESFCAEMDRRQASWVETLSSDARFQDCLTGPRRGSNSGILGLSDRVSVYLCGALANRFEVSVPVAGGTTEPVTLTAVDRTHWVVEPWPLEGDRVRLQCEGRLLPRTHFSSADELHRVLQRAPIERLSFTLMRASAVG
ncbi:MAG: DUF3891 family protein [Holophagae bacterium]|jgi:hypothetical protein